MVSCLFFNYVEKINQHQFQETACMAAKRTLEDLPQRTVDHVLSCERSSSLDRHNKSKVVILVGRHKITIEDE